MVYLANLPPGATAEHLYPALSLYGGIEVIEVNQTQRYAFVKFDRRESAGKCCQFLHKKRIPDDWLAPNLDAIMSRSIASWDDVLFALDNLKFGMLAESELEKIAKKGSYGDV